MGDTNDGLTQADMAAIRAAEEQAGENGARATLAQRMLEVLRAYRSRVENGEASGGSIRTAPAGSLQGR